MTETHDDDPGLRIVLAAIGEDLALAWQRHCGDLPGVQVHRGSILDLDCDAVVSPANSFGFMNGNLDLLYSETFGWHVQERLQARIREKHGGELLVGQAEIVETDHPRIPFVVSAPTMRVPLLLGTETVNPYLAARAALRLVLHGTLERAGVDEPVAALVRSLAIPGLGTGVGEVPPDTCARQVRRAIEDTLTNPGRFPRSWEEAQEWHHRLEGEDLGVSDPPAESPPTT